MATQQGGVCPFSRDKKEKGRIELQHIHSIEAALVSTNYTKIGLQGEYYPFQIGYNEYSKDYTLYILASKAEDRIDWILALRQACAINKNLKKSYHKSVWDGKKWNCCDNHYRNSLGCQTATNWDRRREPDKSRYIDKVSEEEDSVE
ncbi:hypothetical protein WA026_006282, partial [Henosepilachna vigintioctopunctata]